LKLRRAIQRIDSVFARRLAMGLIELIVTVCALSLPMACTHKSTTLIGVRLAPTSGAKAADAISSSMAACDVGLSW